MQLKNLPVHVKPVLMISGSESIIFGNIGGCAQIYLLKGVNLEITVKEVENGSKFLK